MSAPSLDGGLWVLVAVLAVTNVVLVALLLRRRRLPGASRRLSQDIVHSLGALRAALERVLGPHQAAAQMSLAIQRMGGSPPAWDTDQLRRLNHAVRAQLGTLVGTVAAEVALAPAHGESGVIAAQLTHLQELSPGDSGNWVRSWLHGLLRENPHGIVVVDPNRRVLLWSPRAAALTEVSAASAVGQSVDALPQEVRQLFDASDADAAMEHPFQGHTLAVRTRRLANQGRLIVLQRIDRHQERLSEVGRITADAAHEIRSPLGGMLLAAHNLESDLDAPEHRERLALMVAEGRRIEAIVHALLTYSRPDPAADVPVNLADVAGEAAALVRLRHRHALRSLVLDVPPELEVSGQASSLLQVVVNLLSNAAAASPEGGRIEVRGTVVGQGVALDVLDEGPGVAPEVRERLFEPFVTTKPRGEGVGLGLSISRRIAQAHGGALQVDRIDARTRFRLTLPRHR